jgi:hypothetical protein
MRSTKNDNSRLTLHSPSMFTASYFDDFIWISVNKCALNQAIWTNVTIVLIWYHFPKKEWCNLTFCSRNLLNIWNFGTIADAKVLLQIGLCKPRLTNASQANRLHKLITSAKNEVSWESAKNETSWECTKNETSWECTKNETSWECAKNETSWECAKNEEWQTDDM